MDESKAKTDASSVLTADAETYDNPETPVCLTSSTDPCRALRHGRIVVRNPKPGRARGHPCDTLTTETGAAGSRKSLTTTIREHADALPEGALICARDLLHLGNRAAMDKALSRLAKQGQLLRISRGIYVRAIDGEFGKYAPSVEKVVRNIAQATGEMIRPHAAIAAKNWGLTTQVPLRIVYITSGRERTLKFGGLTVRLCHAPTWQFDIGEQASGDALRALDWIGPYGAADALRMLERKLSASDFHDMRLLASTRPAGLPPWLARRVGEAFQE